MAVAAVGRCPAPADTAAAIRFLWGKNTGVTRVANLLVRKIYENAA
jgi:hypothetical protein